MGEGLRFLRNSIPKRRRKIVIPDEYPHIFFLSECLGWRCVRLPSPTGKAPSENHPIHHAISRRRASGAGKVSPSLRPSRGCNACIRLLFPLNTVFVISSAGRNLRSQRSSRFLTSFRNNTINGYVSGLFMSPSPMMPGISPVHGSVSRS